MIQASFDKAIQKGNFAEDIIKKILECKGFVVYRPETEGAHAFDILAIKDKKKVIAIDVKAKARRTYYKDTGINLRHYQEYLAFSERHNMDFWIIFVDEYSKQIYGNTLSELRKEYTFKGIDYPFIQSTGSGTQIIYWHLDKMLQISEITEEQASMLTDKSQRNYEY